MLIEEHGGNVPRDREALEKLPGVGRKTANVVLNVAFGEPTIAVDTHIFRVGNRTGLAPGKTPLAGRGRALEQIVPAEYKLNAHHWLILHGRYVCKARKPECPDCVVADLCRYGAKTPPAEMIAARAEAVTAEPLVEGKIKRSRKPPPQPSPSGRGGTRSAAAGEPPRGGKTLTRLTSLGTLSQRGRALGAPAYAWLAL